MLGHRGRSQEPEGPQASAELSAVVQAIQPAALTDLSVAGLAFLVLTRVPHGLAASDQKLG